MVETCAPCNPVKVERKIRKVLDDIGFKITIETGLKRTEFLDVKLDLCLDTFSPYRKPNNTTTYVSSKSNHPPSILKSIPDMVNQRLCRLSKNETAYKNNAHQYLKDLKNERIQHTRPSFYTTDKKKRSGRRKVTYFHPPFCNSVKTKLGKIFRNLVSKHFNRDHRYYKIFNKNTIKISYSCLPNVKAVINTHNRKV